MDNSLPYRHLYTYIYLTRVLHGLPYVDTFTDELNEHITN